MTTQITMGQFRQRFEVPPGQQSGNGYFSQVFSAIDKLAKTQVSLKLVPLNADPRLRPTGKLLGKLEKISHPNLLRHHEHLIVAPDPSPNGEKGFELFVYELNVGGNLRDLLIKTTTGEEKERIVTDLIYGLSALHAESIGHGNLKPSNILIQHLPHPHARLTDFGLVEGQSYRDAVVTYPPGSIAYLAPEQLLGGDIQLNVDFWALGMIVYELFRGQYTFGANVTNNSDFAARIKSADLPHDLHQIPAPYRQLIQACLVRNPQQRPQKIATLKHILSGESTWENGKEVHVQAPPPPDIHCYNCGATNQAGAVTCHNCDKALTGPAFLKNYRSNNAFAVWALIFFGFCMLPIGFFYYGLYKSTSGDLTGIDIAQKVIKAAEYYHMYTDQYSSSDIDDFRKGVLAIVIGVVGAYYSIFGSLWALFQLLWTWRASNNLEHLGSFGRRYHPALSLLALVGILVGTLGGAAFLPFVFLIPVSAFIPLLILQEIWRGSNPTFLIQGLSWKSGKGSFLITTWWILSMVFPLLLLLPLFLTFETIVPVEWFYTSIAILIAYCVIYVFVFLRVNYRQTSKYMAWAKQSGVANRRP